VSLLATIRDDLGVMALSAAYVLAVIAIAELFRSRGLAREHTRKIIHVGIGMWVVPTFLLFDHRIWAVLPAATFVLINGLSWQFGWIRSMEGERRNIGVILYPLSTALALALFWVPPWPVVGAAAILVMCWGDAAAAIIGRRYGRTHYVVLDHQRSVEGSIAMFAASVVAILASFLAFGAPIDSGVVIAAFVTAFLATVVEAVCPWGLDNLLVPATVAITMFLTRAAVWG
jgi:phytol kinase